MVDGLRRAFGVLTIYPLRASDTWTPEALGSSMIYYPLVGMCLGLSLWMLYVLLVILFPPPIARVLLLGGLVLLTGGLPLDGLADTIDGLNGGHSRQETLDIFKDPHVGAMAVVGVVLVVLVKYASLTVLPHEAMLPCLVLMMTLSRYSMVQLASFSAYAQASGGLGEPFVRGMTHEHFLTTVLLTGSVTLMFGGVRGVMIWVLVSLATMGYQTYFRRRLSGITGDVLGAVNEINETLVLLLATMVY
jgi:adenosylcobinamide-GDP ribazoletransferase